MPGLALPDRASRRGVTGLLREIFFPERPGLVGTENGTLHWPGEPSAPPAASVQSFRRSGSPQEVTCFRCGHDYACIPEEPLVPCPRCGELIDFRDHEVAGFQGTRIRTVGDVVIHPGGSLVGVAVTCENLTVSGDVSGPVHCSGTAEFLAPCRVTGTVACGRLVIGERADVLFLQPVRTAKLEVHGHVLAEIDCAGRASVTGRGVLDGSIVAGGLDIEPGGSLLAVASIRAGSA